MTSLRFGHESSGLALKLAVLALVCAACSSSPGGGADGGGRPDAGATADGGADGGTDCAATPLGAATGTWDITFTRGNYAAGTLTVNGRTVTGRFTGLGYTVDGCHDVQLQLVPDAGFQGTVNHVGSKDTGCADAGWSLAETFTIRQLSSAPSVFCEAGGQWQLNAGTDFPTTCTFNLTGSTMTGSCTGANANISFQGTLSGSVMSGGESGGEMAEFAAQRR
jgi:hypothetical protein